MKEGVIFPPLIVDEEYLLLDGWHRWLSMIDIGIKKTPVMKSIKEGSDKILSDECYGLGKFTLPYEDIGEERNNNCLICGDKLKYAQKDSVPGPSPAFPRGFPKPPFWWCDKCGLVINPKTFSVWKSQS